MIFSTRVEYKPTILLPAKFVEGQVLEDGRTVSAYRVFNECALVLILRSEVCQLFAMDIRNVNAETDLRTENEFKVEADTEETIRSLLYASEWFVELMDKRIELNKEIAKQKKAEKKLKKSLRRKDA